MRRLVLFLAAGALLAFAIAARASAQTPPPAPPGCTTELAHQFDFWVGDWNVYDPKGVLEGTNTVTLEYGTCVVHEHWKGVGGDDGGASTSSSPDRSGTDVGSNGGYLFLDGGGRRRDGVDRDA